VGKVFKPSELEGMTYGSFHRNGMSVDVRRFFKSAAGQRMLESMSPTPATKEARPADAPGKAKKRG